MDLRRVQWVTTQLLEKKESLIALLENQTDLLKQKLESIIARMHRLQHDNMKLAEKEEQSSNLIENEAEKISENPDEQKYGDEWKRKLIQEN